MKRERAPKSAAALRARGEGPSLGDLLDFMRLMWAVDHALQKTSKRMQASLGVTGSQRLVVRIVGKFPGIAAGRLAELLHLHPSTLTGVLKRLEERGLIRRRSDPDDARRCLLELTRDGRRVNGTLDGSVEAGVRRALRRLTTPQLLAARQALALLAAALDSGPGGRPMTPRRPRRAQELPTRPLTTARSEVGSNGFSRRRFATSSKNARMRGVNAPPVRKITRRAWSGAVRSNSL